MGPSPSYAPSSAGRGAAAGPRWGILGGLPSPLLSQRIPEPPNPCSGRACTGPSLSLSQSGSDPVSLPPRPHPPQGFEARLGVRAFTPGFWGDNLQYLRSGEGRGRVPGRRPGSRSGRWLLSARPLRAGQRLPPPASSERRGRPGRLELQQPQERSWTPARPQCAWGQVAQRTGRGATGQAARPERGNKKRGLGRMRAPSPAADSNFSALRSKRGAPGGRPRADPCSPRCRGSTPRAGRSREEKEGKAESSLGFK